MACLPQKRRVWRICIMGSSGAGRLLFPTPRYFELTISQHDLAHTKQSGAVMKHSIFALLLSVLGGCASRPFIVETASPLAFSNVEASTEVMTANDGDVIFEQIPQAAMSATLLGPVEQEVPVRKNAFHRVASGAPLFLLKTRGHPEPTYCTTEETFSGKAPIGIVKGRSCFTDENDDSVFDSVWVGPITTSPMLKTDTPPSDIVLAMITDRTELATPVRYSLGTTAPIEADPMGIVFHAWNASSGSLRKFVRLGNEQLEYSNGTGGSMLGWANQRVNAVSLNNENLPAMIEFVGVTLEAISIINGKLEYRIVGPAASAESLTMFQTFPCARSATGNENGKLCEKDPF